jgi:hypothetical protein
MLVIHRHRKYLKILSRRTIISCVLHRQYNNRVAARWSSIIRLAMSVDMVMAWSNRVHDWDRLISGATQGIKIGSRTRGGYAHIAYFAYCTRYEYKVSPEDSCVSVS